MNMRRFDASTKETLSRMLALVQSLSLLPACMLANMKPTPVKHVVPAVSAAELVELIGGNTAFTIDLNQAARTERGDSFVYSPCSIVHALSMMCAGARRETKRHMANMLRFSLPQKRLQPAFNTLPRS